MAFRVSERIYLWTLVSKGKALDSHLEQIHWYFGSVRELISKNKAESRQQHGSLNTGKLNWYLTVFFETSSLTEPESHQFY